MRGECHISDTPHAAGRRPCAHPVRKRSGTCARRARACPVGTGLVGQSSGMVSSPACRGAPSTSRRRRPRRSVRRRSARRAATPRRAQRAAAARREPPTARRSDGAAVRRDARGDLTSAKRQSAAAADEDGGARYPRHAAARPPSHHARLAQVDDRVLRSTSARGSVRSKMMSCSSMATPRSSAGVSRSVPATARARRHGHRLQCPSASPHCRLVHGSLLASGTGRPSRALASCFCSTSGARSRRRQASSWLTVPAAASSWFFRLGEAGDQPQRRSQRSRRDGSSHWEVRHTDRASEVEVGEAGDTRQRASSGKEGCGSPFSPQLQAAPLACPPSHIWPRQFCFTLLLSRFVACATSVSAGTAHRHHERAAADLMGCGFTASSCIARIAALPAGTTTTTRRRCRSRPDPSPRSTPASSASLRAANATDRSFQSSARSAASRRPTSPATRRIPPPGVRRARLANVSRSVGLTKAAPPHSADGRAPQHTRAIRPRSARAGTRKK